MWSWSDGMWRKAKLITCVLGRQWRCHNFTTDGSLFPAYLAGSTSTAEPRLSRGFQQRLLLRLSSCSEGCPRPVTDCPQRPLASSTNSWCHQRHSTFMIPSIKWGEWIKLGLSTSCSEAPGCSSQLSVYSAGRRQGFGPSVRRLIFNGLYLLNFSHKISFEESLFL